MILLIGFAILAGAGTALSPCVLPVLPALLSAGGVGGRRRPLGIVLGLSITFTVTIVGVAERRRRRRPRQRPAARPRDRGAAGLRRRAARARPRARVWRRRCRGSRASGRATRGDGFCSGLLVGGALGFVYTPCASPILAAVISVSAASGTNGRARDRLCRRLGGRAARCSRSAGARCSIACAAAGRGPALQRALGVVMILTALAIVTNLDVNFDQFVAEKIPDVNLTASLECSQEVTGRLHEITGRQAKFAPANGSSSCHGSASAVKVAAAGAPQSTLLAAAHALPVLGAAPEFTETEDWFNTPGDSPLSLPALRGHVVLVDFWTYTCINCIRTLPYLKAWDAAYRNDGLTIVGVETPEFAFEKDAVQRPRRDRPVRAALPGGPGQRTWAPGTPTATSTGPPTT